MDELEKMVVVEGASTEVRTGSSEEALVSEDARKRLGGYRSHLTKLMKKIINIFDNESPSDPTKLKELISLKQRSDTAMTAYVDAVKELGALGDELESSNMSEKIQLMNELGTRFTAFMAAAAEVGSIHGSSNSSKRRSKSGSAKLSVAKSVKEVAEAEVDLLKIQRSATLKRDALKKRQDIETRRRQSEYRLQEANQEEEMLNLETEVGLQVIEAETAVQKARAVAASEGDSSSLSSVMEEVAPAMSTQEKVGKYVDSITCDGRALDIRPVSPGVGGLHLPGGMVGDHKKTTYSAGVVLPAASGGRGPDCALVGFMGGSATRVSYDSEGPISLGISPATARMKRDAVAEVTMLSRPINEEPREPKSRTVGSTAGALPSVGALSPEFLEFAR